ncbi:MAG: hypothetical protein OXB89_06245 [Anaerolineaceae bacterium]|nr:hypothetical protein [Anaerolineaceae bacterium]
MLESGLLFMLALALQGLSISFPSALRTPANLLIALLPALLWLLNSWWRGGYQPQLRFAATTCAVIAGLLCSALCLPLIDNILEVQRWLPLENAVTRILGYSLTVGLTQALAIWYVVRFAVPRQDHSERLDLLVCCRAAATGYILVASLDFSMDAAPTVSALAVHVFNLTAALNCVAIIVSYALAELYFRRDLFTPLPMFVISLAAFVSGSAIPLVSGLGNASLSSLQPESLTRPLFGNFYSLGLLLAVLVVFRFLSANADASSVPSTDGDGAS